MSYVALYRRYRPLTFNDMIGQEHVTDILKNQIKTNKISHAYIFSGTRGTGKTSAAKIFARAVNCLNPKDGNPCNECEACKSILSGETTDVVEMDAASNNSVENIRGIRQEVVYATTGLKYKIYIIDEAHMLSTSAFNALLKTLEEPPENVIFILATTEEHKILPTILSRCIRFEFRKISQENIVKRLEYILSDNKIEYEEKALDYIAKISDGGMRDALSILERCINENDSKVTYDKLRNLIGNTDEEIVDEIVNSIIEYNMIDSMKLIDKVLDTGKDVRYVVGELANKFMNILLENENKRISQIRLNEIIKELFKLDSDIRQSVNSDLLVKAKILELSSNIDIEDKDKLLDKIKELELRLEKLENQGTAQVTKKAVDKDVSIESIDKKSKTTREDKVDKEEKNKDTIAVEKATNSNDYSQKNKAVLFKEMDKLKKLLVEKDNLQLYSAMSGVKANIVENSLIFETENNFAFGIMNKEENRNMLKDAVKDISNEEYNIVINKLQKESNNANSFEEHLLNNNIPFTVID